MKNIARFVSTFLVLCYFVQIPLFAGAEMQLSEQDDVTDSKVVDVSEYSNSYLSFDDYGTNSVSISDTPSADGNLDLPAKYDSRENGYVTSIKNQGPYGTCWAHAAMAAAETSVLMKGLNKEVKEPDFSEMHFAYSYYNRKNDPLGNTEGDKNIPLGADWLSRGGNSVCTAMYLAQWTDPIKEEKAPYYEIPYEYNDYGPSEYKLESAVFVPETDVNAIKECIMKYGSVAASYYSDHSEFDGKCLYYNNKRDTNHAINIVGWDDTVKSDDFEDANKPSKDGVWIVKNSWGTRGAYKGYFYMSQSQFLRDVVAYDYMASDEYDYNYFYDGSSDYTSDLVAKNLQVANIYEAKKGESLYGEYIKGVSVNIASDKTDCEVQVYTNIKDDSDPTSGTPMLISTPAKICTDYRGVYTIPLGDIIEIEKGTKFSIVVTAKAHNNVSLTSIFTSKSVKYTSLEFQEHTEPNQSFVNVYNSWTDLHGYLGKYQCANVKALTVIENREEQNSRKSICDANITIDTPEYTYSGNECRPNVSVVDDGEKLKESVDYELSYNGNIDAGDASVKVYGINKYKGIKEIPFKIKRLSLTDDMLCNIDDQVYSIYGVNPSITVKCGTKILKLNDDYTVTFENNKSVGTSTVTVYGRKNYTGSIKRTFKIIPYTLNMSMVSEIGSQEYTGKVIKPNITVKLISKILENGTDYTISYGENTNVGTGTVQINGIGNYTGSITKEFQIVEAPHKYFTITANAQPGGSITPSGEISVEDGKDQTFNISTDDGYSIEDVMVDGESIGAVSEYIFTSVKGSHTIEAAFKKDIVKVESIELSDSEVTLKEGDSYTLTAEVKPEQAADKSLFWTSEDTNIAAVDNGVITAFKPGSAVIIVKSLDGSEVTASCKLTVIATDSGDKPSEPLSDPSDNTSNPSDESSSNTSDNTQNTSLDNKTDPTTAPTTAKPATKAPTTPIATTNGKAVQAAKDKSNAVKKMRQAKITKFTAKAKGKKKIVVSWKKVKNAKGYEVQVATNKKFKNNKIVVTKNVKGNKVTIKSNKIKSKKTYYVRIRAYTTYQDANGITQKVYSSWIKKIKKVKAK